jgi:ammonia channel protein AmtB
MLVQKCCAVARSDEVKQVPTSLMQVLGLLLIIGWVGATSFCMFFLLLVTGNLRSSRRAEEVKP